MQEVNVQVAVRVRPLSAKERLNGEQVCVRITQGNKQLVLGRDRSFTFDNVLSSKTTQDEVYDKCVHSLVNRCFEGYNATVFAYGQTGSGKTYTIGGGNTTSQTEDEFGIVPRAIKHMFNHIKDNPNRTYEIKVTYIEVYKEDLHDLLDIDIHSKDIHIREDESGNTVIIGASEVQCDTIEDVMSCLERGSTYRHTGTTQMNEYSSRSHSVFTIFIEQKWNDDEPPEVNATSEDSNHYMCAKFHFVDLAGSERAHRTGNVGDRFKESVHINSGLLALGNVISALGDPKKKVTHIPYRESKITRLLKDSLGGNSNTWMICCISPASSNFDESLNALKYANRARNIKNKPIVNRDPHSIKFEEMQSEIKALREELQRQRTSVVNRLNNVEVNKSGNKENKSGNKELENKLDRIQTECYHYKMIANESYKHLVDIQQRDVLSSSINLRLTEWLQLMEEMKNKVPSTLDRDSWENETIIKLETELNQVRNDLTNDEEIFAEKMKEVNFLEEKIKDLELLNDDVTKQLEEALDRQRKQEEQLVTQQVLIEELEFKVKSCRCQNNYDEDDDDDEDPELNLVTPKDTKVSARRAKSVPVNRLMARSSMKQTKRNIHTSPALFSLERVMAGFRARSQLLLSRIEDSDDVKQPDFSDDDVEAAAEVIRKSQKLDSKTVFNRNAKSRGTYRVNKSRAPPPGVRITGVTSSESTSDPLLTSQTDDEKLSNLQMAHETLTDVQKLKSSTEVSRKKLKQTELDVRQSTQKMRDLEINIRMKEQLIRELVKTGRDSQLINRQNEDKIRNLEKEKQVAKQELLSLQKALTELEAKEAQDKHMKEKLQGEFKRKMELAKTRLNALQKRQKETERVSHLTGANDKRITDLEVAIERMRQQHDLTKNRLKDEIDRKAKLQRDLQKGQQQIKELEVKNEQQKKVLKIKTEEVAAVQRRFRGSVHLHTSEEQSRIEEQRRWLDNEMEKVLHQRKQMEILDKELGKREEIILKKEAMLDEKSELEMKKLRSSQVLSRDMLRVSTKLESMERKIDEKSKEMIGTPRDRQGNLKEEIKAMNKGRDQLKQQRGQLDEKLREGAILSGQEERRLIELDEALDAIDAAIDYKNYHIESQKRHLRESTVLAQSDDNILSKLSSLSAPETRVLLTKYFDKVIDLREAEQKKQLHCTELEMKLEEDERIIRELEASLEHAGMERERVLIQQQKEHEHKVQVLIQQINNEQHRGASGTPPAAAVVAEKDSKIQQLEKDLFYYKKTSRDLKKKLKDIITNQLSTLNMEQTHSKAVEDDGPITAREKESTKPPTAPSIMNTSSTTTASSTTPRTHSRHSRSDSQSSDGAVAGASGSNSFGGAGQSGRESGRDNTVRISRKDLRRLSTDEVLVRKSTASELQPIDSLEAGSKNPWT